MRYDYNIKGLKNKPHVGNYIFEVTGLQVVKDDDKRGRSGLTIVHARVILMEHG